MSLGRSKTTSRNKSRSPAPPPTSPSFKPPSYYAAAGGLTLPTHKYVSEEEPELHGSDEDWISSNHASFMPISFPPSDLSSEFADTRRARRGTHRQSQMTNLPMVEAQLLPSLRDTIDRMTRAPIALSPSPPTRLEKPRQSRRSVSPGPRLSTLEPISLPQRPRTSMEKLHPSTPEINTTPKLPVKPPLKSALRSPTPQIFSPKTEPAPTTPTLGSSTFKSVRSLLRRKSSASSSVSKETPKTDTKYNPLDTPPATTQTRSRSCTDPGTLAMSANPSPPVMSTPQPPNFFVKRKKDDFVSHIPRPRGKSLRNVNTDDSDLEYRYEVHGRDRRKLVVANAEVLASSSSSEVEFDFNRQKWRRELAVKANRHMETPLRIMASREDDEDDQSVYEPSLYSTDLHASPEAADDPDEAHRRRRAALLGLVSGLQLDPPAPSRREDESEYSGEEGVALGGTANVEYESESEYGEEEDIPTVLVSSDDGAGYVHDHRHDRYYEDIVPPSPPTPRVADIRRRSHRHTPLLSPHNGDANSNPRQRDSYTYESVKIAERTRAAAARVRQEFGLPPSESTETDDLIPHEDSVLSAVGSEIWEDGEKEMSLGAEALFRKLSGGSSKRDEDASRPRSRSGPLVPSEVPPPPPPPPCPEERKTFSERDREATVRAFFDDESQYISNLDLTLTLFVLPLRVQDGKRWIAGVPGDVAKLLDWLEDIRNVHVEIEAATQNAGRIAGELQKYIPRLEVYVPYLVKLADSLDVIQSGRSDFLEFVRLQESEDDCRRGGWTLEKLLMEPVRRIEGIIGALRDLLQKTPKTHQDYVATVALLRSTDLMVKAMAEVKVREEEYELLKSLFQRIEGLSASLAIAKRDRRLLMQGRLCRWSSLPTPSGFGGGDANGHSSKLMNAINDWSMSRGRAGSNASTATGLSYSSTSSAESAQMPETPTMRSTLPIRSRLPAPPQRKSRTSSPQPTPTPRLSAPSSQVHILVMSDLLVMVDSRDERWCVPDDFCIGRILDVTEMCEQDPPVIVLDVLPVDLIAMENNAIDRSVPISLFLTVHDTSTTQTWLSAFRDSLRSTLRVISNPSQRTLMDELDLDMQDDMRQTVDSILTSGLPFPKSPSAQLGANSKRREQEERGWWSVRFQQVLREVQRQDVPLSINVSSSLFPF